MERNPTQQSARNSEVVIRTNKASPKERAKIDALVTTDVIPTITTLAWNHDSREIWDIPSAQKLANELLLRWPALVNNEKNSWLIIAAGLRSGALRCIGKDEQTGEVRFESIKTGH